MAVFGKRFTLLLMLGLLLVMLNNSIFAQESVENNDEPLDLDAIDLEISESMANIDPTLLEEEPLALLEWKSGSFHLRIRGELAELIQGNSLNESSLLNPNNYLDAPKAENDLSLALKVDANFSNWFRLYIDRKFSSHHSKKKEETEHEATDTLNQGYISLSREGTILLLLGIGKQRIEWGTGGFWNPVDSFNVKQSMAEREEEKEGKVLYRLDAVYNDTSLTLVHIPNAADTEFNRENFERNDGASLTAGKLYTFLLNTDFTLYHTVPEDEDPHEGISFSTVVGDIQIFGEVAWRMGDSEKYYLEKTRDREETTDGTSDFTIPAIYMAEQTSGQSSKYLLGFQYTNKNDTTFIGELYHNTEGYDKEQMDTFLEYMKYSGGDYQEDADSVNRARQYNSALPEAPDASVLLQVGNTIYDFANFRKNYLHFSVSKPYAWNSFDLGVDVLFNIDDWIEKRGISMFFRPSVVYTTISDWLFTTYSQHYIGAEDTEFGFQAYSYSVFFEVKYFF